MYCSGQRNGENATVAQLVEYDLAKVGVAGSSPVSRSQQYKKGYPKWIPFLVLFKPCRARTFEVSALLRSLQSERPLDVLQRLALYKIRVPSYSGSVICLYK